MTSDTNTTLKNCRICKSNDLHDVIDLGELVLTGRFPASSEPDPLAGRLAIQRCANCGLIQLKDQYPLEQMYGATYGYRSSVTNTMRQHLQGIQQYATNFFNGKEVNVLDIGSNDGTLLSYYGSYANKLVGIDPCAQLHTKNYPDHALIIEDFFSENSVRAAGFNDKFDIITSIAMFYDLHDPVQFASEILSLLDDDGIWITEQTTSHTLIEQLAYDSICHEHLTYLSIHDMQNICAKAGFKIIDISANMSNGSSLRFTMAKKNSTRKENVTQIAAESKKETAFNLTEVATWSKFEKDAIKHRSKLISTIKSLRSENKTILGFGASTKGNVILQYCDLTPNDIPAIIERDPRKFGKETPGTRISIISEEDAKQYQPDIYLIFPWHFKDEIIEREQEFLENGGGLLFLLPEIELVTKNNSSIIN